MRYLVIRTENLSKRFDRRIALDCITFDVEPGEIYAVLGPTGAGKSTLVQLLLGTIRPSQGRALVLGLEPARQGMVLRQRVGYVPEQGVFYPWMRGEEILRSLAQARRIPFTEAVRDLAGQFGLDLERSFSAYSPSERKVLFLVQAFMYPAEVLILDEPMLGLGVVAQDVFSRLARQARAEGRTIFFTTSSLLEAERLCDRVALLWQGRVLAVERGVQLRAKTLRRIEMRFATPVAWEAFAGLPNLEELQLEDNKLRCTLRGDPDAFLKVASRYRITDFISQQPSLDEIYRRYYGVGGYVA
ncbi:ABC transporter ATP-binding protein [uncultured Thermanaerothrix sp.]|uniref:ABC transporter ATP-binding protein n=1 Tax=uncultured Thermanaerothrix sp. TaxID=1195149 RepID=UPI00262AD0A3|nr:ABC transporter ATP-binding protein [uncultured Thermanaerothrix sp.]